MAANTRAGKPLRTRPQGRYQNDPGYRWLRSGAPIADQSRANRAAPWLSRPLDTKLHLDAPILIWKIHKKKIKMKSRVKI